jgi:predicted metal-dependent hydrolase
VATAVSPSPASAALPVRRLRFEYPDELQLGWNPVFPELACAANSISLLMPYVEPYFVRSVRGVLADLGDGTELQARTEDYLRQELQHHVQHRRFNQLLAPQCRAIPRIESVMRRTFGWLGRTRSSRFNVAFAAASETVAFGIARWVDRQADALLADADPVVATLFLWHLAEEVEHKTAAFDVFEATDGSRLRYAAAAALSVALLILFTVSSTFAQLWSLKRLRYPVTWFRLTRWSISLAFTILPLVAASCLPSHRPATLADPPYLRQWLRGVDPASGTAPVWSPGGRAVR